MLLRPLAAVALAAAALDASPAAAAYCFGEQTTVVVCAETPEPVVGERTLCVYTGGDDCTPVGVPTLTFTGAADVNCGGQMLQALCYTVNNLLP